MGRDRKNEAGTEQFTKLVRRMMETDAWRALSPTAQALYPWIRMEWKGPKANNNGRISLSVRQAAERMGIYPNTAARAFHDLQAKGFLVVTQGAYLGASGAAKAPTFELTELPLPSSEGNQGRKLYNQWRPGEDFPVKKASANNPGGRNGREKPCHHNDDNTVIEMMTKGSLPSSKR